MIVGRARVGRYDIERHLASGGMAEVYLARDPQTGALVALKIPHDGEEIWEAERTGAALQIELSHRDSRVPRVYEIGDGEERFVAMEYVEGEDLSRRIQSGPLDWREATAIAIELCGVLATARSCSAPTGEPGGIVHGDIKPRNIRLQERGRIKVLDFGIAKALRQTRDETRNFYGSVPYSSPERLDRGHVDYHSDLWSVAVVLYEMLEGCRPFRAESDIDLERAIRTGTRPAPLEREVPVEFEAVLQKALAPALIDRYASAPVFETDLRAVLLGSPPPFAGASRTPSNSDVVGAPASGNEAPEERRPEAGTALEDQSDATRRTVPAHEASDSYATRRTTDVPEPFADSDATRRTSPANGGPDAATRRTYGAGSVEAANGHAAPEAPRSAYAEASEATVLNPRSTLPAAPAKPSRWPALRIRRVPWRLIVIAVLVFLGAREMQAFGAARGLRANLTSRPRGEAPAVWNEYRRISRGHPFVGLSGAGGAVREWMVSHADDLISRYRSDTPTIYENGWRSAEALLQRAATIDPGNRRIQARLEYCRAHLLRIAARDAKVREESMSRYDEAVSRFERAARLWSGWGDPHIGLAQIYAYGKRDPELTSVALERARGANYPVGERETALLGDAYRLRAERRWAGATDAFDTDQHFRHLDRIREDCVHALDQYELVPSYAGVSRHLRSLRQRLAEIDARQRKLMGEPAHLSEPVPTPVPVPTSEGAST